MSVRTILLVSGPAKFSTRDVWEGYRESFREVGIQVIPYPTFAMLRTLSPEMTGYEIVGKALDTRTVVDAVVFVDGLYFQGERAWVPETIRAAGKPTVLIATDDPYDPIKPAERLYKLHFSNEIHNAKNGIRYLPTATLQPPSIGTSGDDDFQWDVVFIGTLFEDRLPLIRAMAHYCDDRRLRMLIAGTFPTDASDLESLDNVTVERRTIPTQEKWRLYSQSRCVLNAFRDSESPAGSPSPRVFEVAALGRAALLSGPARTEVRRIFGNSIYQFEDAESLTRQFQRVLDDEAERRERVARAQEIAIGGHLYRHRAQTVLQTLRDVELAESETATDDRLAWIIGCGRTGSTWLNEMLNDLPGIRGWHEPYFGRVLRHPFDRPEEYERQASFFFHRFSRTWSQAFRRLFFDVACERFPEYGQQSLVVKEVNTPELFPRIHDIFPGASVILLSRDPFDILDSYLALQQPGSWNKKFGPGLVSGEQRSVQGTAEHIHRSLTVAIDAYDAMPAAQRLRIHYEDLLENPVDCLVRCGKLVAVAVSEDDAAAVVEKHAFATHAETGPRAFRRFGKAGVWKTSGNFTPDVTTIADEVLGGLRTRLGYATPGRQHRPDEPISFPAGYG